MEQQRNEGHSVVHSKGRADTSHSVSLAQSMWQSGGAKSGEEGRSQIWWTSCLAGRSGEE